MVLKIKLIQKNGFGPFDENIFSWNQDERNKIKKLSSSLEEALITLDKDRVFWLRTTFFLEI